MTITLDDEPCCAKQGYHQKARRHDNSLVILSKTDSAAGRQENPLGFNAAIAPSSHLIKKESPDLLFLIGIKEIQAETILRSQVNLTIDFGGISNPFPIQILIFVSHI